MGGRGTAGQSSLVDQTSTTTLPTATPEEVAIRKQFEALGESQQQAIMQLLQQAGGSGSVYSLTPQDQAQLDAAYNAANLQYDTAATKYADTLAGSRGLRMSDTPVSQQAISQYGLGKAQLASDRALQGLNLGFQANQFRTGLGLAAAQAAPIGLQIPYMGLLNERFAQPTTRTQGFNQSTGYSTQPLMQTILQGTQAYNQWSQGNKANMEGISGGLAMAGM